MCSINPPIKKRACADSPHLTFLIVECALSFFEHGEVDVRPASSESCDRLWHEHGLKSALGGNTLGNKLDNHETIGRDKGKVSRPTGDLATRCWYLAFGEQKELWLNCDEELVPTLGGLLQGPTQYTERALNRGNPSGGYPAAVYCSGWPPSGVNQGYTFFLIVE